MRERIRLWLPAVIYMVLIFALSAQSNPMPALTEHVWDKLLHATEYAVLGFLLARALVGEGLSWMLALFVAVMLACGYAFTDEYHQGFVPNRTSDVHDWMADTLGSAVGALGLLKISEGRLKSGNTPRS